MKKLKQFVAYLVLAGAWALGKLGPRRERLALANALVTRTVILGVKEILFARDGAEDGEDTVSETHKPLADSDAYESLGRVEKSAISNKREELKIRNAKTGKYGTEMTIPTNQELMFEFTMQNINQLFVEALYLTSGPITVATPAQPMNQEVTIKGWLQVLRFDHTNTGTITDVIWCELTVPKMDHNEKAYTVDLMATCLRNTLNTVNIPALAAL